MPLPWEEWCCGVCGETNAETPNDPVEEQFSLGLYAGRYHDRCWPKAGYRMEGPEGFDPMDAGESYEPLD
jgi:hypothetical protein